MNLSYEMDWDVYISMDATFSSKALPASIIFLIDSNTSSPV
jgi:hypothetical protein